MADAKVTGAKLSPILTQLKTAGANRPMNAGTFADWSTEAGDKVKLKRGSDTYESQVYSSTMTWKGSAPTVEMNSTGNKKRDPIAKVKRQKYGRSGAGGRIAQNTYNWEVNQQNLLYEVMDPDGKVSRLVVTVDGLNHEVNDGNGKVSRLKNTVDGLSHEVYDATGKVSRLKNTVDGLYHEVYEPGGAVSELQNTAQGFRTRISKVVDANGTIKAAEIATAINNNESYVITNADHVIMGGSTLLSAIFSVNNTGISAKRTIYIEGTGGSQSITLGSNGNITALKYIVPSTGEIEFRTGGTSAYTLTPSAFGDMIKSAETVGTNNNTLRLYYWKGGYLDFSKATSLGGSWSGSTLTVTASPQNEHYTIGFGGSYGSHDTEFEVVANGNVTKDSIVANAVVVPLKVGSLNSGSASTQRYTKNLTVSVAGLLQTKTLTSNGTYPHDSSYIGMSSVTVNVTPTVGGEWNGSRKFTATANPNNAKISTTLRSSVPDSKRTISGDTVTATIQATVGDSETFEDCGTVTINVPASTPSASDIQLYGGGASQITRSTSAPSGTGLSALAQQLVQAYLNTDGKGRYVRFPATITGGTGTKWYYIYM